AGTGPPAPARQGRRPVQNHCGRAAGQCAARRQLNVVADAAYHGPALRTLPANVTWTCRPPQTAVLYGLAPSRTGRRGRHKTRGERLGTPADRARHATWATPQGGTWHGG